MSLVGELAMRQMQSVLADLRAAEARAEAERERAERLRMALLVAEEPLHDHGATWLSCHPARLAIAKALADADRRRAGQGEPADDFDWTAWAHGHIAVVERENDALREANAALTARVRELEEVRGELLRMLDAETGVTVRVNGTGRTTAIDIKLGEWPFLAFDRHTGELVS